MTERYPHEGEAGGETMTPSPFNVLRLGYRKGRDPRITTHLALVSRALGATNFMLAGDEDADLFENIEIIILMSFFGGKNPDSRGRGSGRGDARGIGSGSGSSRV